MAKNAKAREDGGKGEEWKWGEEKCRGKRGRMERGEKRNGQVIEKKLKVEGGEMERAERGKE